MEVVINLATYDGMSMMVICPGQSRSQLMHLQLLNYSRDTMDMQLQW